MKITCPHCGLSGRISEEKLKGSSGNVRCPRCRKTFSTNLDIPTTDEPAFPASDPIKPKKDKKGSDIVTGTRSVEDIPFTRILDNAQKTFSDDLDIDIEISPDTIPIDTSPSSLKTPQEEEILPLDTQETIIEDISPLSDEEIDIDTPPKREVLTPRRKAASGGLSGLLSRIKRQPTTPPPSISTPKPTRKKGISKGFIYVFVMALVLWSGYWFFSTYWPPYVKEKEFLSDSRALFVKYHELMVYLKVGLPDPVFATKVAEAAYVYEIYQEKYQVDYQKDPLFVSLIITGRLFLAVKELLDRDMSPDNFLGLEWGEGFPYTTKEDYINALVSGIPLCITAAEKNFMFAKETIQGTTDFDFITMVMISFEKGNYTPDRLRYGAEIKKINADFLGTTGALAVVQKAVGDIDKIIGSAGK